MDSKIQPETTARTIERAEEVDDASVQIMLTALVWIELAVLVCPLSLVCFYLAFPDPRLLLISLVSLVVGWPAIRLSRRLALAGRVEDSHTVGSAGVLAIALLSHTEAV